MKRISIIAIFKDPRQLEEYDCCNNGNANYKELGSVTDLIREKITKEKMVYYRQNVVIPVPNKQIPR